MAADGSQMRIIRPLQACNLCKTRKKKCDKSVPSCGYCTSKQQDCVYGQASFSRSYTAPITNSFPAQPSPRLVTGILIPSAKKPLQSPSTDTLRFQVYAEVYNIIRDNGQFVDEISARYFQSFHHQLPIISRTSFYNSLAASKRAPPADCSLLLLTMSLFTSAPGPGSKSHASTELLTGDRDARYLAAKSLYAQVQVCSPLSTALIQIGLLLAMYEYMNGQPQNAFVSISASVRLAYTAKIHTTRHINLSVQNPDSESLLEAEEAANTWWGIVIYERIFYSEIMSSIQPLLSSFPAGDARLPIEAKVLDQLDILEPGSLPNIPLSCLSFPNLGGFSRTAQAACFLDQVYKSFEVENIDSRLLLLSRLDTNIQSFLSLILPQGQKEPGIFCSAMNITIRTLFILHWHIVELLQVNEPKYEAKEAWLKKSHEALETVAKMVMDIADLLVKAPIQGTETYMVDTMPPQYPYIARVVLEYLRTRDYGENLVGLDEAEDILQVWFEKYSKRWQQ